MGEPLKGQVSFWWGASGHDHGHHVESSCWLPWEGENGVVWGQGSVGEKDLGGGSSARWGMLGAFMRKVTVGNGEKWTDSRGTWGGKACPGSHHFVGTQWCSLEWMKTRICPGVYVEMIQLITNFTAEDPYSMGCWCPGWPLCWGL